jgi:NADH-quinone oxidoreductase subunit M
MLYERKHTYEFKEFGGLATPMPVYATFFLLAVLSSVGLPLLNGFVGEFLVLSGAFQSAVPHGMLFAILGSSGVIWGACYLLWMYQKVFYGQIHHDENKTLPDIDGRERISLVPLVVMAVIMGVASPYWMKSIQPAVVSTLPQSAGVKAQAQKDQRQEKPNQKTVAPALPAVAVQNASATGGQK